MSNIRHNLQSVLNRARINAYRRRVVMNDLMSDRSLERLAHADEGIRLHI